MVSIPRKINVFLGGVGFMSSSLIAFSLRSVAVHSRLPIALAYARVFNRLYALKSRYLTLQL